MVYYHNWAERGWKTTWDSVNRRRIDEELSAGAETMCHDFRVPISVLDGCNVLFAAYTYGDYSGDAFVLYEKDGKLFEVNGGHCSCYGLEDQWEPEEVPKEALLYRLRKGENYGLVKEYKHLLIDIVEKWQPSIGYNPNQQKDDSEDI